MVSHMSLDSGVSLAISQVSAYSDSMQTVMQFKPEQRVKITYPGEIPVTVGVLSFMLTRAETEWLRNVLCDLLDEDEEYVRNNF